MHDNRDELLEFIDKKVLDPILEALPEQYSSKLDRERLISLQKTVAEKKESFHKKNLTASQIRDKYFCELFYETHHQYGKELEDLELPRLLQLRKQFIQLCNDLHV